MSSLPSSATSMVTTTTSTNLSGDGFSPAQSLLSLSIAASSVAPIPLADSLVSSSGPTSTSALSTGSSTGNVAGILNRSQRRLSSAGKARRRFSDARDAAVRPSPATLSLATLSLSSSSPSPNSFIPHGSSVSSGGLQSSSMSSAFAQSESSVAHSGIPINTPPVDPTGSTLHVGSAPPNVGSMASVINSKPISIKNGKKRGMEHKCEGCSKVNYFMLSIPTRYVNSGFRFIGIPPV
ncbi:hypothetical protein BT96DRAFT_282030 [Gymnopus androsaceus JB14]|uniref:Uncharacterized protein n=1 Tax=Gymnopus androsaceus JB14 TaxID=1447944 RepID=A0A6A4I6J6_9AGAR|nr:hypothetical protein BT96DRAFT_282030 [Gymnopus androsaceus JB14]